MHGVTAMEAARTETPTVEAAHTTPAVEASDTTAGSDKMQERRLVMWTSRHRRRGACRCGG